MTIAFGVLVLYLLPSILAFARNHRNKYALLKFNLFGGWTGFGWLTALVWALYAEPSSYPRSRFQGSSTLPDAPAPVSRRLERAEVQVDTAKVLDMTSRTPPKAIPKLSGDLRPLIPRLGLRNYWYPAILATRVGSAYPVQVRLLGEDLCLFRTAEGDIAAIQDICPHRGARLSEGDCHWPGTVACPYHGWVYDQHGKNVAVLGEGPEATVCGQRGTEASNSRRSVKASIDRVFPLVFS